MDSRFVSEEVIPPDAVRQPTVAGKFYPAELKDLRRQIKTLLRQTPLPAARNAQLLALIAPHAGYRYSGGVAAYAFKLLPASKTATVVVIAPSHFERFPFISVFTGKSYRTPLGEVPVATALAERLLASDAAFAALWHGHRDTSRRTEHALEVQLPFLQTVLPRCAIVPVIMGQQDWETCAVLGQQLAKLAEQASFVMLASSDLSHFHAQPEALQLDHSFIELLSGRNPRALYEAVEQHACEACGAGPVIATMIAAQQLHADAVEVLSYGTSGEVSGDFSRVVGYLAASFTRAA